MPWGADPLASDQSLGGWTVVSVGAAPSPGITATINAPPPSQQQRPRNPPPANGKNYTDQELLDLGLNPALLPIVHRESGGRPNIGWTDVDLSNVPRDAQGFPIWSGIIAEWAAGNRMMQGCADD
jgi:hypothetical protein